VSATHKPGCAHIERVAEYALSALPARDTPAFAAHVEWCAECRAELASLRPVVDAFVDWPADVVRPPVPLWSRLAERIGGAPEPAEPRWAEEPAWTPVAPGIEVKLLATDEATDCVSMLVRLAPGAAYPAHRHAGVEELHLLDGELWIDDRKLVPGDYNRAEPGTSDARVWSETGCTCVLVTSYRDALH